MGSEEPLPQVTRSDKRPDESGRGSQEWLRHARSADAALVLVTFFWGATFILVKAAIEDASTLAFIAVRFGLAAILLAAIYRSHLAAGGMASLRGGVAAGICLWVGYSLQTAGLRLTTPSKSAFLTSLCVVMVPLLSSSVYRVVPRISELIGVGLALSGTALMTTQGRLSAINQGDVLTVGAAFAFAAHILVLGHYTPRVGYEALSVWQVATVAACAALTCGWLEPLEWRWSRQLIVAIAFTAVFCTALAFTVQSWAQRRTSPTSTALILALEPVFATATAWVVSGTALSARGALGAILILAGVLSAELKPGGAKKHPV